MMGAAIIIAAYHLYKLHAFSGFFHAKNMFADSLKILQCSQTPLAGRKGEVPSPKIRPPLKAFAIKSNTQFVPKFN